MNYRRPRFLEVLIDVRQAMARDADYDVDLFAEMVRSGSFSGYAPRPQTPDEYGAKPRRRKNAPTAKSAKR